MLQAYNLALFNEEDGYRNFHFDILNITQNRLFTHALVRFPGPFSQDEIRQFYYDSFDNLTALNPAQYQAWKVANENLRRSVWARSGINKTHVVLTQKEILQMDPIVFHHLLNSTSMQLYNGSHKRNTSEIRYVIPIVKAPHGHRSNSLLVPGIPAELPLRHEPDDTSSASRQRKRMIEMQFGSVAFKNGHLNMLQALKRHNPALYKQQKNIRRHGTN